MNYELNHQVIYISSISVLHSCNYYKIGLIKYLHSREGFKNMIPWRHIVIDSYNRFLFINEPLIKPRGISLEF